ncbi:Zinc finger, C2H [Trema orientale]|uniref:Zinc finger, C2H n=1 Tax=Trema orientale TaxID=63057 RepID=A0A2P5F1P0_TREOI|nr:Zinc finger, C2H [Trema orientale]
MGIGHILPIRDADGADEEAISGANEIVNDAVDNAQHVAIDKLPKCGMNCNFSFRSSSALDHHERRVHKAYKQRCSLSLILLVTNEYLTTFVTRAEILILFTWLQILWFSL